MTADGAAAPALPRPARIGGTETCRLTVAGPGQRADLTVPATVTMGELLPVLLRRVVSEEDRDHPWVLQRLGEEPLDADATPEMLDLRHGDVLYLRPADRALPPVEFDDVAVGVATAIGSRPDRWRPGYTRRLLLGLACLPLAAFLGGLASVPPPSWRLSLLLGVAAAALTAGSVAVNHLLGDVSIGVITGVAGCLMAGLAGLTARHGLAAVLALQQPDLLLASICAGAAAGAVLAAGRVPITPFGTVAVTAAAAVAGCWLAQGLHWDAVRATALLAVAMFVLTVPALRVVLRAARLRAPQLPRTADELQEDIEPEPGERLHRRADNAVAYLNSVAISAAIVSGVAFAEMLRLPGWIGLTLTAVLASAVLLRTKGLVGVWQRSCLAVSGTFGLVLLVAELASRAAPLPRAAALLGLLAAAGLMLTAARRLPGSRLLPIWGHLADLLELWTALALIPLLLQLLHVYVYFRGLIG
jgi:ESX secretion system protein EccD